MATKTKRTVRPAAPRAVSLDLAKLETMMMDYAERKPALESPIFRMAKECGLVNVVTRIQRLRSYARSHRTK